MDFGTLNFVACLALHQSRRDKALGLNHITTRQRGLIWYYNTKKREIAVKSFYYGITIGARKRIKQIKRIVKADTPLAEASRLYQEALILRQQIDKAQEIIDG